MGLPAPRPPKPAASVYQLKEHDKVCLVPRLSLSELLTINGLVREICERSAEVMLLAKRDHVASLRCLYADVPNLRFKFLESWAGHEGVFDDVEKRGYRVVPLPSFREACPYTLLGLSHALAAEKFVVSRSLGAERAVHEAVVRAVGPTYIVVHHDESRPIRRDLVPEGIPVVDVRDPQFRTDCIFDWIQTIDGALQFHGIDSCFLLMADALALRARKYFHAYASPTTAATRFRDVITIWG